MHFISLFWNKKKTLFINQLSVLFPHYFGVDRTLNTINNFRWLQHTQLWMFFSERHMEMIDGKIQTCNHIIDACLGLMQNLTHLKSAASIDPSFEYLVKEGDFFLRIQLAAFNIQYNYLHEIVTPGVPDFGDHNCRKSFSMCVRTKKLITTKSYKDPTFYNELWYLITSTNHGIQKLNFWPPVWVFNIFVVSDCSSFPFQNKMNKFICTSLFSTYFKIFFQTYNIFRSSWISKVFLNICAFTALVLNNALGYC